MKGKRFGAPPKKGPQPQGMQEGGQSQGEKFVEFFGQQFNQNKDKVINAINDYCEINEVAIEIK